MGGAQFQIKCLVEHLRTLKRYDVHYVARRVREAGPADGHTIHRIGDSRPRSRFGYAMDAPQLLRALRGIRPHVIYQRIGCAYTGIAALYAGRSGARLIWHASSDADLEPALRVPERNFVRRRLERTLLNYGIRHADIVVTQTRRQDEALRRNFGRDADAVIANFHPDPTEQHSVAGPARVLWVANLKRLKQPDAFLRLAASLADLRDVRFVMVGAASTEAGESEWNRAMQQQIAALPNVDYLGQRPQDEVNRLLSNATLFVNTSLYEGFPNTFIQAWLRDTPVVSLSVNPDNVFDDESLGYCAGTEARLSEIVRGLLLDDALRRRVAARAGAHAREFHSMVNAARLEQLIHQAACSASGAATVDSAPGVNG
jgi:glycosyltransferase involved in cell wall biosynthesis